LKKVAIKVNNQVEKLAALTILSNLTGIPIGPKALTETMEGNGVSAYPYVIFDVNVISGRRTLEDRKEFSLAEVSNLKDYLKNGDSVEVVLNDSYTAIVSKDTVKVGCQTFPITVLKALVAAHKKLNKK